jgi:hypothetical protein
MTAQGHPRAIFERAIERRNLLVAEATLRAEIPRPTLLDLLELVALYAEKDPRRHSRAAVRWLERWLDQVGDATLDDVELASSALRALGGRHNAAAFSTLRDLAERATSVGAARRRGRGVSGRAASSG